MLLFHRCRRIFRGDRNFLDLSGHVQPLALLTSAKMLHLSPMHVPIRRGRTSKSTIGAEFRTSLPAGSSTKSASIVKRDPLRFIQPERFFYFYLCSLVPFCRSTWIWWEETERTGRSSSRWRPRRLLDRSTGGCCYDCEQVRHTSWYRPWTSARIRHLRKWSRWSVSFFLSSPLIASYFLPSLIKRTSTTPSLSLRLWLSPRADFSFQRYFSHRIKFPYAAC